MTETTSDSVITTGELYDILNRPGVTIEGLRLVVMHWPKARARLCASRSSAPSDDTPCVQCGKPTRCGIEMQMCDDCYTALADSGPDFEADPLPVPAQEAEALIAAFEVAVDDCRITPSQGAENAKGRIRAQLLARLRSPSEIPEAASETTQFFVGLKTPLDEVHFIINGKIVGKIVNLATKDSVK